MIKWGIVAALVSSALSLFVLYQEVKVRNAFKYHLPPTFVEYQENHFFEADGSWYPISKDEMDKMILELERQTENKQRVEWYVSRVPKMLSRFVGGLLMVIAAVIWFLLGVYAAVRVARYAWRTD